MSLDLQRGGKTIASSRSLMPPHVVLRDFLDKAAITHLLDFALSHQSDFAPTRLASGEVNPSIRVSTGLRNLGSYRPLLKAKILGLVPELIERLQVTPFESPKLETELVAHGDGAFYKRHIDTQTDHHDHKNHIRVLSGVYYFYSQPKVFTGGALRLYAIGGVPNENFIDIEPLHNSLLVFPSWAPHEVMPVSCPSKLFGHSRFAINCWLHRKKLDAA